MKVSASCKFMSLSNRIQGTGDDGREYDYYRLSLFYEPDGQELRFTIRNRPEFNASIVKLGGKKFGDPCDVVLDFVKSRQNSSYFCNFVEVK